MNNSPSSSFLTRLWSLVALIAVAGGVPAAAIAFFSQHIASHPWLSVLAFIGYEGMVVMMSFVLQVGQKLQSRWVDRCVEWVDTLIGRLFSGYYKVYFRYLYYQHRDFDVKGLTTLGSYSLELDQIFVALRLEPTPPMQTSTNPIDRRVLARGSHTLWEHLASKKLNRQHLVIIGPPGSGKTTLLKYVTLTMVARHWLPERQRKHNPRSQPIFLRKTTVLRRVELTLIAKRRLRSWRRRRIPQVLPIFLFLRDHAQSIKDQENFSLAHALKDHLKKWEQPEPPAGWVERQLVAGRCLIMLDGLDEIADLEARQKAVEWVRRQIVAFNKNRFIISSRPHGYRSNTLVGVTVLQILPFLPDQVELFIYKWYLANETMSKQKDDAGVRMKARIDAKDLLQRLRNTPALSALTVNPLLLTMIATVHRYSGELPGNRMSLYAEICEVFLAKRQQARGQILALTSAQMQLVLGPLAYTLMLKGEQNITAEEACHVIEEPLVRVKPGMTCEAFLDLVQNVSGLLLEQESGVYGFAHLTFQEYLAAVYIRENKLVNVLVANVEKSWWQETISLYCAMTDATPILAACLRDDPPSVSALTMALAFAKEARDVRLVVKMRLDSILNEGVEHADAERRRIVAEALLARRQHQMIQVRNDVYRATSLVTCAEYQLFLNEQRTLGRYYQPDHWRDVTFPVGSGTAPVLGMRRSDAQAFCVWLTARDKEGWRYRLPMHGEEWELGKEPKELTEETGYWFETGAHFAWSRAKPSDVLYQQITTSNDSARALNIDLDLNRALDLDSVLELVSKLNLTLGPDLDPDPNRARELVNSIALARARADAPLRGFDFNSGRIHARAHRRARDLEHALDRERARDRALVLALDLDHARDLASSLAYDLASSLARDLPSSPASDPSISRDLNLACIIELAHDLARTRTLDHVRARTLDQARTLTLNLYATLFLLQERRVGRLPAWEGILVVKDRGA